MSVGRALYSYSAVEEDELSIEAGDRIELISLNEDNWWLAKRSGRIGLVPENYICLEVKGSHNQNNVNEKQGYHASPSADLARMKEQRLKAEEKIGLLRSTIDRIPVDGSETIKNDVTPSSSFKKMNDDLKSILLKTSTEKFTQQEMKIFNQLNALITDSSAPVDVVVNKIPALLLSPDAEDKQQQLMSMNSLNSRFNTPAPFSIQSSQNSPPKVPVTENGGPLDGISYPQCRSIVHKPTYEISNEGKGGFPKKSLRLQHIYGYDGDRSRHGNLSHSKNIVLGLDNLILYPIAAVVVCLNLSTQYQSFFSGHREDVSCVAVHPSMSIAASGENGRLGRILIWDYKLLQRSSNSFAESNFLADLSMGGDVRSVRSVGFSGDGRFLVALGLDQSHTIVIFDWSSNVAVASAKLGHLEANQVSFNHYLFSPMCRGAENNMQSPAPLKKKWDPSNNLIDSGNEGGCYTIISCGGKQMKFWTFTRCTTSQDPQESPDAKGFKGRQLNMPKHKQVIQTKYEISGNVGVAPKQSDNLDFTCFVCIDDSEDGNKLKKSRIFGGTSTGCIYIWLQMEDEATTFATGIQHWLPRGRLLSVVTDVHDQVILDMSYFSSSKSSTDQIASCGKDGIINIWSINRSGNEHALPLDFSHSGNLGGKKGQGVARTLSWSNTGEQLIVGTAQNSILVTDVNEMSDFRPLLSSHTGKVRRLAIHPTEYFCASISSDKTLRIWDIIRRKEIYCTRLQERGSCLCFSPSGYELVIGNEAGELLIWKVIISRSSEDNLVVLEVTLEPLMRRNIAAKINKSDNNHNNDVAPKKIEVVEVKFSPSGDILAVACKDNLIHLLQVKNNYKRVVICRGHLSYIRCLDFSVDGTIIQSADSSKELLYWEVATGKQINNPTRIRDMDWQTWTCLYGWPVQGIYNGADGVAVEGEINSVCRSFNKDLVVVGSTNRSAVKLFDFPCLQNARARTYRGHSSPVLDVHFTLDDNHVLSAGGNDTSIFQWETIIE